MVRTQEILCYRGFVFYTQGALMKIQNTVFLSLISASILLSTSGAWAESTSLSINSSSLATPTQTAPKIEEDHQITDPKLKAENGSLNKYSFKASLGVNGPPIGDLSNPKTPNPDGSISNSATNLYGSVSVRYRFDAQSSISFGSGINALTPFNGIERFDVRTPTITYDQVKRVGDWQFRSAPGVSVVTIPEYIKVGEVASFNYDASAFYQLGTTRVRLGTEASFGYYFYNRNYEPADKNANRYSLGFFPAVKYSITDKLGIYSSLNISFWNPRFKSQELVMWNKTLSQRLGLEYSFTRDVFLASYLNFYPKSLHPDSTTINLSTIFSI